MRTVHDTTINLKKVDGTALRRAALALGEWQIQALDTQVDLAIDLDWIAWVEVERQETAAAQQAALAAQLRDLPHEATPEWLLAALYPERR